jgi:hypothetical protein
MAQLNFGGVIENVMTREEFPLEKAREILKDETIAVIGYGFQGQERDVIFISLVRTNEEGQIGFLNDLRRMNVAITRARMKLVILGEAETLKHHGFYRRLLEFIQNIGNQ